MNNRTVRAIALLCLFSATAMMLIGYQQKSWLIGAYGIALAAANATIIVYYQLKIHNRRT